VVQPRPSGACAIFIVRFLPDGRSVAVDGPTDVFQAAASCDILLEQPCAGLARCGQCRVRVVEGTDAPGPADREALTPEELRDGWRLACALTIRGAATIEVPRTSRAASAKAFGVWPDVDGAATPVVDPAAPAPLGFALDIGTTSLAAALIHLSTGRLAATASVLNPQAEFGADVMSRIHAAGESEERRRLVVAAVRRGVAVLADRTAREAGASSRDVAAVAVVGNPAMLHFLCDADPSGLGVAPYVGLWTHARHLRAGEVGLPFGSDVPVYVLPCVRSHVGADAVGAAVAVGLDRVGLPSLLIDLGTNSEIVLGDGKRVVAASTAAGPAFECGGISCGMRAAEGALDALRIEDDGRWSVHTIGGAPPRGICGSGLMDAVSELLRIGVLDPSGLMRGVEQVRQSVPAALRARLGGAGRARQVAIAEGPDAAAGVFLAASDVRQLQLAIGAVRAGIEVLCTEAGLAAADLDTVFVAGTFGQYVRKASLFRLGLLPPLPPERVRTVGNAAGRGAVLALLDRGVRARAEDLARRTRYVELAGRPGYQEALVRHLRFPAGEGER
jgi:uncharacterized 2Fe-2S/4Fe-4S cluster protein (DUF4445 family)